MKNVLLEEFSPICQIQAFVEEDEHCVYFYLWNDPGEEFASIRAGWVRNYGKAPESIDVEAMEDGQAPMLSRDCCAHPDGAPRLDPDQLSIVWFEEGDAAALLYQGEVLSVIPGWAGSAPDGSSYPPYAKDCIGESPFCFPLGTPDTNGLFARIESAQKFWASWDEDPWPAIQDQFLSAITTSLGPVKKYYAIDGGHFPPKAMVTIEKGNVTYVVTLGVSLLPQPKVEQYIETPELLRRFEFAFACETEWLAKNEQHLLAYISGQTSLPWSYLTFLAKGHTIPCREISEVDERFTSMLLAKPDGAPDISFPVIGGDPVNLLWMIPITEDELHFAQTHSSVNLVQNAAEDLEYWIFDGGSKFSASR
ncbi:suppressor of fused domain protein [Brevibacillus reuszeri]|uniref:suppressor of fused domain protein n=1 Tax=Brevibacillus reuszeri TaxID=54915 RepID=UPI0028986CD4|nr:suppressor of fused domain protein [Brevibacillus reuszeri]